MTGFNELNIELLEFDKENPRLPTSLHGARENRILQYLARHTAIENLMSSIGENDFFKGEAIVAIPNDSKFTVVEGNRRLAALRLLRNPELVSKPSIERVASNAQYKPTIIPAYIVETRNETLQYLGFRHISGVQRWEPLAKTRYLKSLFDLTEGDERERCIAVAREIGSNGATVRRNLDALAAYAIIEEYDFYEIEGIEETTFQFGTFYTAVNNVDVANYIGVRNNGTATNPITNPGAINQSGLEELVRYMFERDEDGNTTLIESRNIVKLGPVLADETALKALQSGQSLESAYRLTSRGRGEFTVYMNRAIEALKEANANLYTVETDDENAKKTVNDALSLVHVAARALGIDLNA